MIFLPLVSDKRFYFSANFHLQHFQVQNVINSIFKALYTDTVLKAPLLTIKTFPHFKYYGSTLLPSTNVALSTTVEKKLLGFRDLETTNMCYLFVNLGHEFGSV